MKRRTTVARRIIAASLLFLTFASAGAEPSGTASAECRKLLDDARAVYRDAPLPEVRAAPHETPLMGPLERSSTNPRYFADPARRIIYLTGAHTWNNLVDMGQSSPPHSFDFDAYLYFLRAHHHNLIRLWTWEVSQPQDGRDTPLRTATAPQPWLRTGPGTDVTGQPKFDLTRFDPEYFRRLRTRVQAARDAGMYVIVMLFEGWSVQFSPGKDSHPFLPANNVNDTSSLTDARDVHTMLHPGITQLQRAYVSAVLDTLHDLDNVLLEIVNESGPYSTDWQYAMIDFVKCHQAATSMRHPVGMTYQHPGGSNATLFTSAADWVSPGGESGFYRSQPEAADGSKVIISDSDHLMGSSLDDVLWVYRNFFRGLNTLYMDPYVGADALNPSVNRLAPEIRAAMGHVRLFATHLDLGQAVPSESLSSTGYLLSGPEWMLALAPDGALMEVDLGAISGEVQLEWFDPVTANAKSGGVAQAGGTISLTPPYKHGSVLYLRPVGSSAPSLLDLENEAKSIRTASMRYAPPQVRLRMLARPLFEAVTDGYRVLALTMFAAMSSGIVIGLIAGVVIGSRGRQRRR